jgi:hypothetical protein
MPRGDVGDAGAWDASYDSWPEKHNVCSAIRHRNWQYARALTEGVPEKTSIQGFALHILGVASPYLCSDLSCRLKLEV